MRRQGFCILSESSSDTDYSIAVIQSGQPLLQIGPNVRQRSGGPLTVRSQPVRRQGFCILSESSSNMDYSIAVIQSGQPLLQIENPTNPSGWWVFFLSPPYKSKLLTVGLKKITPQLRCGVFCLMWALLDSNQRPPACKAGALNQLS